LSIRCFIEFTFQVAMRMVKMGVWDGVGSTGRDKTGSGANRRCHRKGYADFMMVHHR
jgi:hypothetical protein